MHISNLYFTYDESPLFYDFEFECNSSLILLMGPSGCGKTTFMKIVSRVIINKVSYKIFEVPDKSYLVLQDDALCPWLSGIDNITKFIQVDSSYLCQSQLFKHTEHFIGKKVCNMSFGQRRMVELLRAISFKPKLLLLDEPFNYLDSDSRRIVSNEIMHLVNDLNIKIILSSHYNEDFNLLHPHIFYFPESKPISKLSNEKS